MRKKTLIQLLVTAHLDRKEQAIVSALEKLDKKWPPTLWITTVQGKLSIMKYGDEGVRVLLPDGTYDLDYLVCQLDIPYEIPTMGDK